MFRNLCNTELPLILFLEVSRTGIFRITPSEACVVQKENEIFIIVKMGRRVIAMKTKSQESMIKLHNNYIILYTHRRQGFSSFRSLDNKSSNLVATGGGHLVPLSHWLHASIFPNSVVAIIPNVSRNNVTVK